MTARDFDRELPELYDFHAHGLITKREFPDRAARFAVGGLTAMTIPGMTGPDYARAEQVPFTDPGILPGHITYTSPNGNGVVRGYLVRPADDPAKLMNDFLAAAEVMMGHALSTGAVGITGFCYGVEPERGVFPGKAGLAALGVQVQRHVARPGFRDAATAAQILKDRPQLVEAGDHGGTGGHHGRHCVPFTGDDKVALAGLDQPEIAPPRHGVHPHLGVNADKFRLHPRLHPHMHHIHGRHGSLPLR